MICACCPSATRGAGRRTVAVWVAVHRRPVPFSAGQSGAPVQLEPIGTTQTRAANAVGRGGQAGSHHNEQPRGVPDLHGQRAATWPRSRTGLNGSGCRYGNLRIRRLGVRVPPSALDTSAVQGICCSTRPRGCSMLPSGRGHSERHGVPCTGRKAVTGTARRCRTSPFQTGQRGPLAGPSGCCESRARPHENLCQLPGLISSGWASNGCVIRCPRPRLFEDGFQLV